MHFRHGQPLIQQPTGTELIKRQEVILALLDRAEDGLMRGEIRAQLDPTISERQLRRALEELREKGLVISTGRGLSARWKLKV